MKYTCIIVEDQPPAQRILLKYIEDYGQLDVIGTFTDAITAINFLQKNHIDLMFLDIHLPKLSGFDFLKIHNPRCQVIITTAFSNYALEGYELNICDYLLKPFSFDRFVKAVTKATNGLEPEVISDVQIDHKNSSSYFIKSGSDYLNLDVDQIRYIKSDGDYTCIFLADKKHLIAHPLRYWKEQLSEDRFCQVHKSYIVSVKWIEKVNSNQIFIGDTVIPIGRMFKETFFQNFVRE